jgi:plastocyanin
MAKKGLDDRGHGLGRRAAARLPLSRAVIIAMLLGPIVGGLLAYGAVAAQEEPNVVTIDNFTFGPKELTVPLGTTVKWVNHDDTPHTVANKDKLFRSKALDTDPIPIRSLTPERSTISAVCIRSWSGRSS